MFQSYEQIFSKRADAYQKAMELYPAARQREFQLVVEHADLNAADVICDAPSGGGYLRDYLPTDIKRYLAVETAPDFTGHCPLGEHDRIIHSPLDNIAIENSSVDVCINLAGSHHLEDKSRFFREAMRILKPGGRLVIADAEKGTRVDRFLNEFVDQHNSMGHEGIFLDDSTAAEISSCGLAVHSDELIDFPWAFETGNDIGTFCKLLFGIDLAEADAVLAGTEDILGYMPGPGKINLAWSLRYIVAIKS
ncbi:MAG: class I SAM-dependent methyltransferase [Xanthomonadales bacterium]|nr:class I SAM-dependent methyltransferase [Xanthomonadales bacterium]